MQYALVAGKKREAFPKGRGICLLCGSEMIAKCGTRNIDHWAHFRTKDCDPWWENETLWHRNWKSYFPEECREVSHTDENGEIHRADVKTATGIIIEFQHSSIKEDERIARENFYQNLIWVVDGSGFKNNFDVYHPLPDPQSELAKDIVWAKAKRHMRGGTTGMFFRLSEAKELFPKVTKKTLGGGLVHTIKDIQDELNQSYSGYHQYDWVRPRKTWLETDFPVYIDFGDNLLVKLELYDEYEMPCIRYVSKRKFIHDVMTETNNTDIATRFYPLPKN